MLGDKLGLLEEMTMIRLCSLPCGGQEGVLQRKKDLEYGDLRRLLKVGTVHEAGTGLLSSS